MRASIAVGGIFTLFHLVLAATRPEPDGDATSSQFSGVDLSYIAQGERALQRALSILQQHTGWQAETMLVKSKHLSPSLLRAEKCSQEDKLV